MRCRARVLRESSQQRLYVPRGGAMSSVVNCTPLHDIAGLHGFRAQIVSVVCSWSCVAMSLHHVISGGSFDNVRLNPRGYGILCHLLITWRFFGAT